MRKKGINVEHFFIKISSIKDKRNKLRKCKQLAFLFLIHKDQVLRATRDIEEVFENRSEIDFLVFKVDDISQLGTWTMEPCIQFFSDCKMKVEVPFNENWSE